MAVGDQYFVVASATGRAGGSTPATTNDGRDPIGFNLSGATYDDTGNGEGEHHIASTGAFTSYVWESGDQIYLDAGAGITAGLYEIASKVDADAILLTASAGSDSTSDVGSSDGPWGDATDETTGLQHAVDTLSGAGTCLNICADANYVLTATIDVDTNAGSSTEPLIFRGVKSNGEWNGVTQCLIDASGLTTGNDAFNVVTVYPFIEWTDMHLTGDPAETTKSAANNSGVYNNSGSLKFQRCRFSWFGKYGVWGRSNSGHSLFIDCEVDHNNYGFYGDSSATRQVSAIRTLFHHNTFVGCGCEPQDNHSGTFVHCQFFRNGTEGLEFGGSTQNQYALVEGCTFDSNTSDGLSRLTPFTPLIVSNSAFTNNGGYGITGGDGDSVIFAGPNAWNSNTSGNVNWTPTTVKPLDPFGTNVTAAPGYIAITDEAADYRPDTTSPLIDSGIELPTP